jgi:hypothetical protein
MQFYAPEGLADWQKLIIGVTVTTAAWILVTFITPPDTQRKLRDFCKLIGPGGPGWKRVIAQAQRDGEPIIVEKRGKSDLPLGILSMVLGCLAVYSALFGTGYWIYGKTALAVTLTVVCIISGFALARLRLSMRRAETE